MLLCIDLKKQDLPDCFGLDLLKMKGKTLLFAFSLYFLSYFLIMNYGGIRKYSQQKALSNSDTLREAKMEKLNRVINRLLHLKEPTYVQDDKLGM